LGAGHAGADRGRVDLFSSGDGRDAGLMPPVMGDAFVARKRPMLPPLPDLSSNKCCFRKRFVMLLRSHDRWTCLKSKSPTILWWQTCGPVRIHGARRKMVHQNKAPELDRRTRSRNRAKGAERLTGQRCEPPSPSPASLAEGQGVGMQMSTRRSDRRDRDRVTPSA